MVLMASILSLINLFLLAISSLFQLVLILQCDLSLRLST